MTTRAKFKFTVKEYVEGTPFIAFEPLEGQLDGEGLPSGMFGFDLIDGMPLKRAEEIARILNVSIAQLYFTALP